MVRTIDYSQFGYHGRMTHYALKREVWGQWATLARWALGLSAQMPPDQVCQGHRLLSQVKEGEWEDICINSCWSPLFHGAPITAGADPLFYFLHAPCFYLVLLTLTPYLLWILGRRGKKPQTFGFADGIEQNKRLIILLPSLPSSFFSSSSSSLSSFLFFFFNKISILALELSETAELVKAVNRTGPFYL